MTAPRDPDQLIHAYFDEGPDELPDPVYDAVREGIEQTRQRADGGWWRPRRWTTRILVVAALITLGGGAALLLDAPDDPLALDSNGWIAYGMHPEDGGDQDIWFVSPGSEPRRVIGSDIDSVDQLCPAFSPDGRSFAYGQVDQSGATPTTAVVVASVNGEGDVSEEFRVDVGGAPPCPVWSPTGDRIAFGVPQTSVINPTQSAAGSEVWILTVADRGITVLPDLLATDLEFSPDGSVLGIASGVAYDGNYGEALADNQIHLYELASGTMRTLEGTLGSAGSFTWSPDGRRIAYQGRELRVIDLATEEERILSAPYGTLHGIGPVWSPDGESIVYQRSIGSGERHDVVVVWPDDLSADGTPREEVVPLFERSADGSETWLTPYWVNWSPDGENLMFVGWSAETDPLLGVVPVASGSPSDILVTDQDVAVNPVYDSGPFVPIQSWGRLPVGAATPTPTPEVSAAGPTPVPSPAAFFPTASPGELPPDWIAYRSGADILAVDARNPDHTLVIGPSLGFDPIAWARDGSELLLSSHPDEVPVEVGGGWGIPTAPLGLLVLHPDGSTRFVGSGTWGSFSPDGTKVAYACCGSAPGPYVVEADGGEPRSLVGECTPGCGEPLPEWAAWSPVSSEIAYIDFWENHPTFGHHAEVLSFVRADGTGLREGVLQLPGEAGGLTWSPDGLRLAFWGISLGENGEEQLPAQIYVVNADGSELRRLTDEGDNRWPSWSPDGTRIAFARGELRSLTGGDGSQIEYIEPGSRWLLTMASDGTDVVSYEGVHPQGPIAWAPVP